MSYVVGVGHLGPVEPICEKLCVDDLEELTVLLDESGLVMYDLEDGRVFITVKDRAQVINGGSVDFDEKVKLSEDEEKLISEFTGSIDRKVKICQLEEDDFFDEMEEIEELTEDDVKLTMKLITGK